MNQHKKDILFAFVTGTIALAAILAMPYLVASPKVLFGRSLSAIPPSLFPYVTLVSILLFSVGLLAISLINFQSKRKQINGESTSPSIDIENDWLKKGAFFVVLVAYGLLLKPLGFLISSGMAITLASLLLGNRQWIQIALLAVLAPACLYLIATRGMLVSLPELNPIELFYSQLIEWLQGFVTS